MRIFAAVLTAALLSAASTISVAADAPWTLDRLMNTLGAKKSGRAHFTETRYLKIAQAPLESSGELVFVAPDHLEKHTTSPKPENLVVDGDMLTVDRNGRTITIPLRNYPELGAFIESIRATLAGNRFALENAYKVSIDGKGNDWTMTLVPIDSRMQQKVSSITLAGTGAALARVEIRQADGDRSLMRLQDASAH
ncbi:MULTISPECIES: LolA family protein [Caballeronia]|uniref:LolA family protein n=1 Tax=Caballeronia TaxID=1827195 RepID=UPI00158AC74D|nr:MULTISPECIES: outer membrane lipoprotein carrier protein LolA [Caballeronia]MCG7400794.1 outer membrane lipoprotein carrier protein LolA [Caballeronia zhejiangensis]MCI1043302.1 outer membrane lipoprotein carrier protein LolA [Caballeronia zhejiangensis]